MAVQFVPEGGVPGEGVRPPRLLWLRSLSSKLVAGVVALVVVLVTAIGAVTYFELKSFLLTRLDQQLDQATSQNAAFISDCIARVTTGGSGTFRCFGTQLSPPQPEWLVAYDGTAVVTPTPDTPNLTALSLSSRELSQIRSDPNSVREVANGSTTLRVTAQRTPEGALVVTGLSTEDIERTLRRLVNLELIIGAGAVAIAFAATTIGVQRSLRNLYKVTGTAREVTAELSPEGAGLDRRVPVVEEGTEVGQLAESVNTLLSAVESQFAARVESEQRMRQFLADASHELRTPLTSIRGFAELARMQRAIGEASDDNLDRIESEGTRMSRLVEDLLLLARGDDPDNAPTHADAPVDLAVVADDVVAAARAGFPERQLDLEITPVPPVAGDRDQLFRVVRNLVTNACVHTAPERPILTRVGVDGADVVVQVLDGGPGLAVEDAAQVFDRFWRADKARTRARGGSGLGMSIVATLVRAHGGTVAFESTVETGSTVTVRLPAVGGITDEAATAAD